MNEETRLRLLQQFEQRQAAQAAAAAVPPDDVAPSWMETGFDIANQLQPIQGIADMVSGDQSREFDYPELPPTIGFEATPANPASFQGMMGFARDDQGKLDIYQGIFPDDPAGKDEFGNIYVEHNGQMYYLDRPGLSPQDAPDIGTSIISEVAGILPFARLGRGLIGGSLGQVVGTGAGAAAGSLGQDAVATAAGSEQGFDVPNAVLTGLLGLGGEAGSAFARPIGRGLRGAMDWFRGGSEAAPAAPASSGANALIANPADRWGAEAAQMVQPTGPSQMVQRAQGLPAPVQLSRGDVSPGMPAIQRDEEMLAGGGMGRQAADVMQQFRAGQTGALNQNLDMLQAQIGVGAVDRAAPGGGMDIMQSRLLNDIDASTASIDAAYDAARTAGRDATLSEDGLTLLADDFVSIVRDNAYDIGQMPMVTRRLQDMQTIMNTGQLQPEAMAGAPVDRVATQINDMEQWRRRLSTDIIDLRGVPGAATERRALLQMVRRYDDFMSQALDNALVEGNQEAIDLWRNAVGLRRTHFEMYEQDDLIRRITETTTDPDGNVIPAMSPQQSLNLLFGANSLATSRTSSSIGALRRLRSTYGAESPEWNALREEAFARLAPPRGNINDPAPAFTAFVRNFDRTMQDAPQMMNVLFTRAEQDVMRNLRDTVELITTRSPGVVNRSGSGHLVLQAMSRFFTSGLVGGALRTGLSRAFGWVLDGMRGIRARDLVSRPVESSGPILPRGLAGLMSGGAGNTVGSTDIWEGFALPTTGGR